jgi:hypothetical protein
MPQQWAGYGESLEPISCWCEEISLEEINNRTYRLLEEFKSPDKVFLSLDLYADLLKSVNIHTYDILCSEGPNTLLTINTAAGTLSVVRVPFLCNFCLVGTEDDYNLVERAKIDQAFEEIVFDGEDNVCGRSTSKDNELPGGT